MFVPLRKHTAELYETQSTQELWKINALRAKVDLNTSNDESDDLISLKDIFKKASNGYEGPFQEAYIMLDENDDNKEDHDSPYDDQFLIVKRANLLFNDKECVVLNFENITSVKKLKQEEEKSRLMSTLYSSVHHEMIGPLKSNIEAAVRLIRYLKDNNLRMQAQIILVCSKQVILHANDLLDQKLIQNGSFTPERLTFHKKYSFIGKECAISSNITMIPCQSIFMINGNAILNKVCCCCMTKKKTRRHTEKYLC